MSILESHVKNIIKANDEGRLTIFVGAGISKSSNGKGLVLPSWGELISVLKKDLDLPDETDYLKIAQLYFLEFKAPTYYRKIKEFFPDYVEPSLIHDLIFEINPQSVITTNWDNILERAAYKSMGNKSQI
jgi:NAD-dependent SIR2 family protein deacetylase